MPNNAAAEKPPSDYPSLVVTKYMGSKKAILPFVAKELERLTQPGDIIVDLMAGTHTIGYALKRRCLMVANDIQRFSRVIGETLLNYNPEPKFESPARDAFRRFFNVNIRHLNELFAPGLRGEGNFLKAEPGRQPTWVAYRDFCQEYPFVSRPTPVKGWPEEFMLLFGMRRMEAYRTLNKLEPYSLFSLFYANSYVGVRQAAEIDSLRYAIDKICDQWLPEHEASEVESHRLRCFLLTVLINVLNRINPGPGHWAAFPHVSQRNRDWLMAQRSISAYELFFERLVEFEKEIAKQVSPLGPHIIMSEDYVNFMAEVHEYIRQARVVYLDPPYSQGHYSRFYHLIETLVKYDYPEISFNGRYRSDRHQSPFARKDKVNGAVGLVCEIAREGGAELVISYSQGGVIPDSDAFRTILEQYYPADKIELRVLSSAHSKMGKAERMKTVEYLFTCHPSY